MKPVRCCNNQFICVSKQQHSLCTADAEIMDPPGGNPGLILVAYPLSKSVLGQNTDLHAPPADRTSSLLLSANEISPSVQ